MHFDEMFSIFFGTSANKEIGYQKYIQCECDVENFEMRPCKMLLSQLQSFIHAIYCNENFF